MLAETAWGVRKIHGTPIDVLARDRLHFRRLATPEHGAGLRRVARAGGLRFGCAARIIGGSRSARGKKRDDAAGED